MSCSLTDLEITKIFGRLEDLVTDVYQEAEDILSLEIDLSKRGLEDQLSKGFWNDLLSDDINDLQTALDNNTAFNPSEVATAGVQFSTILTTLFGGDAVVSQLTQNTKSKFSQKVDGAFDNAFASCDNNVSAIGTIQGIVGIQARKLDKLFSGISATFGILLQNNEELGPAVFINTLKNYLIQSTAQNLLLEQIQDEIKNINEDIEDLTDSDYSINHKTILSAAIVELRTADNILRAQLDNVLRKFPINMKGYEEAKKHIDDVRDALCGIDLEDIFGGYLSLDALKITARLIYLQELLDLLKRTDEETEEMLINLGSFDTLFEDVTFFDELFVPVLQLIRCRLGVVMADMKATIDKNKLASFVVKEKLWCFELAILSSLMNAAKIFDIDTEGTILDVAGLEDPLNALFLDVKNQHFNVSIDSIINAANQYIKNVQYKLSFNVPVTQIQARGNLVNRLIDQRILENESFGLLINERTLTIEGSILSGITILNKFLTAVDNVEALSTASSQIQKGNLQGLFSGDFLAESLKGTFEGLLDEVSQSLEDAGCSLLDAGDKALSAYDIFEDTTRADALFNESLSGFPETHLREAIQAELPKYNRG